MVPGDLRRHGPAAPMTLRGHAWQEWADSDTGAEWEAVTGDGLADAPR